MKATVVILTFNGETYLADILNSLRNQKVDGGFETLVIDSGSSDSTLQIVSEFPEVRLHQIPNSEFGHGKTRNLAAQLARGEFVVYLTHDAVPADEFWLAEMLVPFDLFPRVDAVLGRQIARPQCVPILKYEIDRVFESQGAEFAITISFEHPIFGRHPQYGIPARFYSDVNSAARRSLLLERIPYRDVAYAEDQLFGQDVLKSGAWKAYAPRGAVIHSNDLTYREYKKRLFDEIVGLRLSGAAVPPPSHWVRALVRALLLDPADIVQDRDYSAPRKLYWLLVNPFFHLAKRRAVRKATRIDLSDPRMLHARSLEAQRKAP